MDWNYVRVSMCIMVRCETNKCNKKNRMMYGVRVIDEVTTVRGQQPSKVESPGGKGERKNAEGKSGEEIKRRLDFVHVKFAF